jgi:hypothetical protein
MERQVGPQVNQLIVKVLLLYVIHAAASNVRLVTFFQKFRSAPAALLYSTVVDFHI